MNPASILDDTLSAVRTAADFIQQEIGKVHAEDIETKALNSLVTYVDKQSEKILVEQLGKILPSSVFLTEEETIGTQQGEWQWIIDPLDGTTNFIHSVPVFAISVALKHKDEIVLGVVTELNRNECFHAVKNNGAFLNGKPISVSKSTTLADSLIATGFPYYDFHLLDQYLAAFKQLMQSTRGIRRLGSAAVDLCFTACGRFDVYFEYSLSPWDVAAGALIVQEAGGAVFDFHGGDNWLFGREIIACNPNVRDEFLKLIGEHF